MRGNVSFGQLWVKGGATILEYFYKHVKITVLPFNFHMNLSTSDAYLCVNMYRDTHNPVHQHTRRIPGTNLAHPSTVGDLIMSLTA